MLFREYALYPVLAAYWHYYALVPVLVLDVFGYAVREKLVHVSLERPESVVCLLLVGIVAEIYVYNKYYQLSVHLLRFLFYTYFRQ